MLLLRLVIPLLAFPLIVVTCFTGVLFYPLVAVVYIDLVYAADAKLEALANQKSQLYLIRVALTLVSLVTAVGLCTAGWT